MFKSNEIQKKSRRKLIFPQNNKNKNKQTKNNNNNKQQNKTKTNKQKIKTLTTFLNSINDIPGNMWGNLIFVTTVTSYEEIKSNFTFYADILEDRLVFFQFLIDNIGRRHYLSDMNNMANFKSTAYVCQVTFEKIILSFVKFTSSASFWSLI